MLKIVKSLVITGYGINCEEELAAAYTLAGAETKICHLNDIFNDRISIHSFDIINFPGGFSFGDDLGAGKVLAGKMKFKRKKAGEYFFNDLKKFISEGKFILGICNGFQFLVKMGLLPNVEKDYQQEVTLTFNDSAKFEDRWIYVKVNKNNTSPFFKGLDKIYLPVRHKEGKLIVKNGKIKEEIIKKSLNVLSYCDTEGKITNEYPYNPNGSDLACAALTDKTGRILGMMPHPEAFLSFYNHPDWNFIKKNQPEISEKGEGLKIFENIVNYLGEK